METNSNYYKDWVFDENSYSGNKENQNEVMKKRIVKMIKIVLKLYLIK